MTKMEGLGAAQGQGWLGVRVGGMGWERLPSSKVRIGVGCGGNPGGAHRQNNAHSAPFRAVMGPNLSFIRLRVMLCLYSCRTAPGTLETTGFQSLLGQYVNLLETPAAACPSTRDGQSGRQLGVSSAASRYEDNIGMTLARSR